MAAFSSRLVTLLLIVLLSCFVDRCCSPQCRAYRQEQYVSDYCYELSLEGVLLEPFSCRVSSGWAWQLTYLTAPGGRQFVLTPAWSGGSDQLFTPPYRVASQLFYVRLCLLWSRPYSSVPFRPRPRSSISCVICSLLLLISCGDVELNPGPVNPIKVCQVASYNICSAVGKAASVHDILADFNLDILALSETRIKVADPPAIKNSVAPEGYSVRHVHRSPSSSRPSGGGLAVIYRNSLAVRQHPLCSTLSPATFELQLVTVSTSPALTIVNVYRPPQTSVAGFIDELGEVLSTLTNAGDRLLVCGDFNCPGADSTSVDPDLAAVFSETGLTQHVQSPTRVSGNSSNLLDVLATDASLSVSNVRVDDAGCVSDHSLVTATVSVRKRGPCAVPMVSRATRNIDTVKFEDALRKSALFTSPSLSVDGYVEQLERIVVAELDRVAPLRRRVRRPPKPVSRWLSDAAVNAKRKRRRLERRWIRTGQEDDRLAYRRACRQANRIINDSRRDYYRGQLATLTDSKDRWKLTKHLLHSNTAPQDRTELENSKLCTSFSYYFGDKIRKLKLAVARDKKAYASSHADPSHIGDRLDSLRLVTSAEVSKILFSMPAKSSPLDFIPTSLMKSCNSVFSDIITTLANLSFEHGTFPSRYKFAVVTPLPKKADATIDRPDQYRPISNLNNISKVIEKLFLSRIQPHVLASVNFNHLQSAYRQHHSTETALLHTLNNIYCSSDIGKPTVLVSLDLSAAFDMIEHNILLHRLYTSFGISGAAFSWLNSYLSGRSQCVRAGHSSSSYTTCQTGVPQGSVLGPLLFSLYISPIGSIARELGVSLQQYADDTQLYISTSASELTTNISVLEVCLTSLHSWFCQNGLALNSDKSECILFGMSQRLKNFPNIPGINIAGTVVPLSDSIRTLGVTLDKNLSLSKHVSAVCGSANFHIRALRHIRRALTEDMAKALAVSLVQSRLDYANSLVHGACNIKKLQTIQNSLARIVLGSQPNVSAVGRLTCLHWLPVHSRITFKIACLTYKTLATGQPTYLRILLNQYVPSRQLRSSSQYLLEQRPVKTEFGKRSFSYMSPYIWNSLPYDVKLSQSYDTFKRRLKTHLTRC